MVNDNKVCLIVIDGWGVSEDTEGKILLGTSEFLKLLKILIVSLIPTISFFQEMQFTMLKLL